METLQEIREKFHFLKVANFRKNGTDKLTRGLKEVLFAFTEHFWRLNAIKKDIKDVGDTTSVSRIFTVTSSNCNLNIKDAVSVIRNIWQTCRKVPSYWASSSASEKETMIVKIKILVDIIKDDGIYSFNLLSKCNLYSLRNRQKCLIFPCDDQYRSDFEKRGSKPSQVIKDDVCFHWDQKDHWKGYGKWSGPSFMI